MYSALETLNQSEIGGEMIEGYKHFLGNQKVAIGYEQTRHSGTMRYLIVWFRWSFQIIHRRKGF